MDTELAILKALIANTDLRVYADNDVLLNYALDYAVSEVNKRRCYTGDGYEAKFRQNVIEGAVWRLNRLGVEGSSSSSELGVSTSWQETPDWLVSVLPMVRVVSL